jgi:hypothetical protein
MAYWPDPNPRLGGERWHSAHERTSPAPRTVWGLTGLRANPDSPLVVTGMTKSRIFSPLAAVTSAMGWQPTMYGATRPSLLGPREKGRRVSKILLLVLTLPTSSSPVMRLSPICCSSRSKWHP